MRPAVLATTCLLAASACWATGSLPASAAPASAQPVRYTFDGGLPADLRVVAGRGGTVRTTPHDGGLAALFPERCRGSRCPTVILERANGPDLNPGTAPFHYGASVLVRRDETAAGSNVVQKGYANRGGEWKLQVDGAGGYPSCVLVGRGSGRLHTVRSSRSVADGQWHQVTCWRSATAFAIAVDGVDRGRVGLPAGLDITNTMPLRIGGKHARAGNDQYAGAVDDVFFARD